MGRQSKGQAKWGLSVGASEDQAVAVAGDVAWRHSSFSQGADHTCVDVAFTDTGAMVRDSKVVDGPVLLFTAPEWQVFLLGVRAGEFDWPQRPVAPGDASELLSADSDVR